MSERTKLQNLQSEYSDLFKDHYGFRPRHDTDAQWNDEAYLEAQIQGIIDSIEGMKATFAGREELREQGWHVEETEPDLIQWAAWLKAERDRYYADIEVALDHTEVLSDPYDDLEVA